MRTNVLPAAAVLLMLLPTPPTVAGQDTEVQVAPQEPRTISLGGAVSGELVPEDSVSDGRHFKVYRYEHHGEPAQRLLRLTSTQVDPVLQIRTPNGGLLAENDDDLTTPFTLNSRLLYEFSPGAYHIVATTFEAGETGTFNLIMDSPPSPTVEAETRRSILSRLQAAAQELGNEIRKCPTLPSTDGAATTLRDFSHPWHFTDVAELTSGGSRHAVHEASRGTNRETGHRATAEVDRESKVRIEFARDWLTDNSGFNLAAAIRIRGQVVDEQGVRNVEIPGYSLIGEQSRQATARIGTVRAIHEVVCPVADVWNMRGTWLMAAQELQDTLYSRYGREIIQQSAPTLRVSLQELTRPENRDAVRLVALEAGEDPDLLVALGERLAELLERVGQESSKDPTPASLDELVLHWRQLARRSARMGQALLDRHEDFPERLVTRLKDTEISVSETGASNGDRLILYIENDAEGDSLPRRLQINLIVRDFGFTRRINDAALLVKRSGVSPTPNRELVSVLSEGPGTLPRDTTVSLPYNFAPTPGVTFGWSWYPRDLGSERRTELAQWLNPGVGINVSFPRFGEKTVRLIPPADGETAPSFDVEEETDEIGFAAGMVVSLFGNALQATVGWNLTAERDRFYWGLGFSFAQVIGSVSGDNVLQDDGGGE